MRRTWTLASLLVAAAAVVSASGRSVRAAEAGERPNIIYIMADDLGRNELGCYGQEKIRTPHIDRLATEGMRFTQFYSGAPVCAPARCVLLTGKHTGHAFVRDNAEVQPEGQEPIPDSEVTVAELLKEQGYVTGGIGKWGLGYPGSEGDPNRQGFDFFYGYNCQRHAHTHYPTYLRRNDQIEKLEGNPGGATGQQYSHDLFEREALRFVRENRDRRFFLYLPFTVSHLALQVPEDSLKEYLGKWDDPPYKGGKGYFPHPTPRAAYAAMVTRMDRSVGRLMDLLRELDLEKNTLVIFTSDNGPTHDVGGADSAFFDSAKGFRGLKGSMYEGGIRVPFIARWPGKIRPGTTSDHLAAFEDVMPTLCEVSGAETPAHADGVSFLPTLLGRSGQKVRPYLYWEFAGYGGQQGVRMGNWKAVRQNLKRGQLKTELYNLADDLAEQHDVSAQHPEVLAKLERIMAECHTPSQRFPLGVIDGVKPVQGNGMRNRRNQQKRNTN